MKLTKFPSDLLAALWVLLLTGIAVTTAFADSNTPPLPLKSPSDFDSITDRAAKSRALFIEAAKVIQSPRCLNCHPKGDSPSQGDDMHVHYPAVVRGPGDRGVVGMMCTTCHQEHAVELAKIPGAPNWHLAPISAAWVGKSAHEICVQLKDPNRNGGRNLNQITDHIAHDPLVGWAWHPGENRTPAPGTQEKMGALIAAWVETGAKCPQ